MKKFVGYYRVSTEDQGKSGLGLEAQRTSVLKFIEQSGELIGEFQDVESGTSYTRKGIQEAIDLCKLTGATLVVKEMSRISRGGFKIMVELEEAGVEFIESTAPHDPSMVKGIKFVLAKDEREKISVRTKDALSEIKTKISSGKKHISKKGNIIEHLGSPQNLTDKARNRSIQVRKQAAKDNPNNKRAGAFICSCFEQGDTYTTITDKLNTAGFKTSKGNDFSIMQVSRLHKRYAI